MELSHDHLELKSGLDFLPQLANSLFITRRVVVNAYDKLQELKSKIEAEAQIQESPTVVTEIAGNQKQAKMVVMEKVEGKIQRVEFFSYLVDDNC